ncbi:guanylate-binding protein 1-like [Nannospalax galili]|uniref:guanylate-binding protein 1-like n=1 Tax=Nannospalax galili TaxID=1026970 RepID=UPI00111BFD42|nr:guanylate-binding protein 1-like [Nannospalax galili]
MALELHMPEPMCLIENVKGHLRPNQEALEILSAITQPVVVVAIVGFYRTGKSYLMNKLAGKKTGFSLGSTVQSHTKGIWMWCVPHPHKSDHTLVLLDTEGLGDVEKGDNQNDCWIFALTVLLSSTFVYNSMGAINQQAMDQLHYVTELTKRIRSKSSPGCDAVEDSANFVSFFPDFVWTLRDMTLKLEIDGQLLTADQYLENSLKLNEGTCEEVEKYNLPRLCIRKFFPKKKCFVFYPPTEWKKLRELETLQENEIDSEFLQQVAEFCCYISSSSKVKTLPGGLKVNGSRLEKLVLTYVEAISSGDLPCMENAVSTLAQLENSAAVKKAIEHYDKEMGQKVQLPTETIQELLDLHRISEKEAIEIFFKNPEPTDHPFLITPFTSVFTLQSQLEKRCDDFCKRNVEASSTGCQALLQDIFRPLEEAVKQGTYSNPGGYSLFLHEMQRLTKMYHEEPRKGVQAEEILQKYLQSIEAVSNAILQMDTNLNAKEKEIEAERKKTESALAAAKLLEETQKENEKLMEQKEKSFQEYVKQLTEKMENDRAQLKAEQETILALKLQEQKQLLQEGFQEESRKLQEEMWNAERRHKETMDHLKAESSETISRMSKEMQEKYELMLGNKDRNYQEHVQQLIEKMEQDRAQQMAEQDRAMALKLQEQQLYFKEELAEERRKYEKEIQDKEMKNREMNIKLEAAQAENAQAVTKMVEEVKKINQHMVDQKEKMLEERVRQLANQIQVDKDELKAEHDKVLNDKLQEQENNFNAKIKNLREEKDRCSVM